jgi:hypothetical protein
MFRNNHLWFGSADGARQLAAAPTHQLRASYSLRTISRLQEEKKIVFQFSDTSKEQLELPGCVRELEAISTKQNSNVFCHCQNNNGFPMKGKRKSTY